MVRNIPSPFLGFPNPFGIGPGGGGSIGTRPPTIVYTATQEKRLDQLPVVFSVANGNSIVIDGVDSPTLTDCTIVVLGGTSALAGTTGLTFDAGDGSAAETISFSGSVANANAALNGLTVTKATLPVVVSISVTTVFGTATATITIQDTIAPTISSLTPADNSINVALNVTPIVTFSEPVKFGPSGLITLRRATPISSVIRAADGLLTNLLATGGVLAGAIADADGGAHAVRLTSNVGASAFQCYVIGGNNVPFNFGLNSVSVRIKDVGANAPWCRVSFINVSAATSTRVWFQPSTGTLGSVGSAISNLSLVPDVGSDGWVLSFDCDLSIAGGSDALGSLQVMICNANGSQTIVGSGTEAFRIHDMIVHNHDREQFNVVTEVGTSPGQVSISGNALTIRPAVALSESEVFSIYIPLGAITDMAGNPFAGILNNTTWNFTSVVPDTAPPGILTTYPADNALAVPLAAVLQATFNEDVVFHSSGSVTLRKKTSGVFGDLEVFDVATEVGTTAGKVNIVGSQLSIYPGANFLNGSEYAIRIGPTTIKDTAGNFFPGIADDATWNFVASQDALYNVFVTPEAGGTTVGIAFSYNKDLVEDGNYYLVIYRDTNSDPDATEIQAGQDGEGDPGAWWTTIPYDSLDSFTVTNMNLTPSAGYKFAVIHKSDADVVSNIVIVPFTTAASGNPNETIIAAFGGTVAGAFYDFNDRARMLAGVTAGANGAVSVNGNVGVVLDKKYNLAADATKFADITTGGWTNVGAGGGVAYTTFADHGDGSFDLATLTMSVGNSTAYSASIPALDLVAGEVYRITGIVTAFVNSFAFTLGLTTNQRTTAWVPSQTGPFEAYLYVVSAQLNASLQIRCSASNSSLSIQNMRVEKVVGHHLRLGATAAKFVLDGGGIGCVEFDSTDRLYTTENVNLGGNDNLLICAAFERTQNAADAQIFQHGSTVQISGMAPDFAVGDEYTFNDGTADLEAQSATTPEKVVYTATRVRAGTAQLRINGVLKESGAASSGTLEGSVPTVPLYVGSTSVPNKYFAGRMYALAFYNAAFDSTKISDFENAFAAKSGVTI